MNITKQDFDGLGKRVTNMEIASADQKTRTVRNEKDIQSLYRSVSKLPIWILGAISLPSLGILYQIVTK